MTVIEVVTPNQIDDIFHLLQSIDVRDQVVKLSDWRQNVDGRGKGPPSFGPTFIKSVGSSQNMRQSSATIGQATFEVEKD